MLHPPTNLALVCIDIKCTTHFIGRNVSVDLTDAKSYQFLDSDFLINLLLPKFSPNPMLFRPPPSLSLILVTLLLVTTFLPLSHHPLMSPIDDPPPLPLSITSTLTAAPPLHPLHLYEPPSSLLQHYHSPSGNPHPPSSDFTCSAPSKRQVYSQYMERDVPARHGNGRHTIYDNR